MASNGTVFATTRWSVVLAAGDGKSPHAREALERLCGAYWYPLYAHVRRRGCNPHDAQDMTQSFFLQLIESDFLARADPRKGRFRTFLLVALNHFLTNEWHRIRALKRGGNFVMLSWDGISAEDRYHDEPYMTETPERLFERRWAIAVVDRAVERLRQELAKSGRGELFDSLKGVLTGDQVTESYGRIGIRFGLTEAAIKMTVLRLRRRFGELLREEVAHTVGDEAEVDEELRHLLRVLADTKGA